MYIKWIRRNHFDVRIRRCFRRSKVVAKAKTFARTRAPHTNAEEWPFHYLIHIFYFWAKFFAPQCWFTTTTTKNCGSSGSSWWIYVIDHWKFPFVPLAIVSSPLLLPLFFIISGIIYGLCVLGSLRNCMCDVCLCLCVCAHTPNEI